MVILPFLLSAFFGLMSLLGLTVGIPAIINTLFGWFG